MEEKFIKITNSVYRILDFLPDSDPLKNKAKEKVLAILENVTLVSGAEGWVSLQKEKASAQLLDDIEVLINYLVVGKNQGWIDTMNFLIITKEYCSIKSDIKAPQGMIKQTLQISESAKKETNVIYPKRERLNNNQLMVIEPATVKQPATPEKQKQKFNARQSKILQMLGEKEKAQVSDMIKELPNITKRTVRRDLDDLLKKGKIVRIGDFNQVFYRSVR